MRTSYREQYGNITLTVTPKYLNGIYSVPETRTISREVITDGIEFIGITNDNLPLDYTDNKSWNINIRNSCYAQPETGHKWVFMNYDYWQTNFPNIDYKILYLFGISNKYTSWGTLNKLENAAMQCIENGKHLIVTSNAGLSILAENLKGYKATDKAKEFYKMLGIEYRGFIYLSTRDTLNFRVVNPHQLNLDINDSNATLNSINDFMSHTTVRTDYIGINNENTNTFPFLWYNRSDEPPDSYAAIATTIGTSKIIYLSCGLETIAKEGDTLLIRNFLNWMLDPTSVTETNQINDYNIYPNPADKFIELSFINPTLKYGFYEPNEIRIFNSIGENVSGLVTRQGNRIFIENLSVGSYFCILLSGGKTICKPFIICR